MINAYDFFPHGDSRHYWYYFLLFFILAITEIHLDNGLICWSLGICYCGVQLFFLFFFNRSSHRSMLRKKPKQVKIHSETLRMTGKTIGRRRGNFYTNFCSRGKQTPLMIQMCHNFLRASQNPFKVHDFQFLKNLTC